MRTWMPSLVVLFLVAQATAAEVNKAVPVAATGAKPIKFAATDWPWWRGPTGNGVAAAAQEVPIKWTSSENVLWKTPIPGRGHGSATVVGDQVFLTVADHQRDLQAVLCLNRNTGKQLWETVVHKSNLETKGNAKSSQASTTPACDGSLVFVNFLNGGAIYTTALTRDGKQVWQTKISDYVEHQGYAVSPAIYKSMVLTSSDNKAGGAVAGLERATGNIVWKHDRPKLPNYASPVVINADGRDQLIFIGCKLVSSYDPLSGKSLWEIEGATEECVTSTVTDGTVMFTTGGYPKNHIAAVKVDGSGETVWEKPTRVYVPSMLIRDGYLYAVTDAGVAYCYRSADGEEMWKQRLGGTFSSSPVLVGETIYVTNEEGQMFVFKAKPEGCEMLAENKLGDEVFSSPTICGGRIYLRVAERQGDVRQEMLYCIGEK
jgi:outer membrane protein assembly factor BamB